MRRLLWLMIPLAVAGCGGGKSSETINVTCSDGTELHGAASAEVLGDVQNGHPTIAFPDPVNAGRTGTITVPPHGSCKITGTINRNDS